MKQKDKEKIVNECAMFTPKEKQKIKVLLKPKIILKIETMSYDNDELIMETKDAVYILKDKRAICILADRLTTMKKKIQREY